MNCKYCGKVLATDADYKAIHEGEGEHLCWADYNGGCDVSAEEALDRALAIVAELKAGSNWQPIATAPRDGTPVLILCPGNRQALARFTACPLMGHPESAWCVVVPCMGGYGYGSDTRIHWDEDQPTHWMPLPPPPKKEEGVA